MKIKLDLYSSTELKAFATFCETLAVAREAYEARNEDKLPGLSGIARGVGAHWKTGASSEAVPPYEEAAEFIAEAQAAATDIIAEQQADVEQAKAATRRERGKPGEGRARRTKAEIAEDEAWDRHEAAGGIVAHELEPQLMSISTGEERVSPDDVQDAADEADETASTSDGTLTHDDLRRALGTLGIKAGVAAVKEGGLLGMTVDKVPTDQIGAMIAKIEAAKAGGETAPVEDKPAEAAPSYPATKSGLMSAMLAYALKYDGTNDVSKASMATMPATMTDAPKVFAMRFGEDVNSISKVPADGYEQAVKDIIEATEKNPFKREVK